MSDRVVQREAAASKQEMAARLAQYLERQAESVRASDRLMKRLEAASLALPASGLVAAVAVVLTSSASLGKSIPAALFGVAGCLAPWVLLLGLHSIVIRAFPPLRALIAEQTGKAPAFFMGPEAVGMGAFVIAAAVVYGACCAMGSYAFFNPRILRILIPLIVVFSFASGIASTWLQARRKRLPGHRLARGRHGWAAGGLPSHNQGG